MRYMEIIAGSKGRVIIPANLRKKFKIKEGTRFQVEVDKECHQIILKPITREYIHSLKGKFKGKGMMKNLIEEKKVNENYES